MHGMSEKKSVGCNAPSWAMLHTSWLQINSAMTEVESAMTEVDSAMTELDSAMIEVKQSTFDSSTLVLVSIDDAMQV